MPRKTPDWKYIKYDIEQLWERIALRRRINTHPRIIIAITNVTVIIFLILMFQTYRQGSVKRVADYGKEWFYDLNTGQLFTADKKLVPPIESPSGPLRDGGPAGVRAYVFSYVEEPNESQRYIGFLEKVDPNFAKEASKQTDDMTRWGRGKLIRRAGDKEWVPADSRAGREILQEALVPNENGQNPYYTTPK